MALDGNVDGHVNARGPLFHDGDGDVHDRSSHGGGPCVTDGSGLRDCDHRESGRGRDAHGQKRSCQPG